MSDPTNESKSSLRSILQQLRQEVFDWLEWTVPVLAVLILIIIGVLLCIVGWKLGVAAWQSDAGARAFLVAGLTFACILYGGFLITVSLVPNNQTPVPKEGLEFAKQIFLYFFNCFLLVVGFYFGQTQNAVTVTPITVAPAAVLGKSPSAEAFSHILGGSSPYVYRCRFGRADWGNPYPTVGIVRFTLPKKDDIPWPKPVKIEVIDSRGTRVEQDLIFSDTELKAAGFEEISEK
jgi:hypothetical protein